jgi:hypothetical protein
MLIGLAITLFAPGGSWAATTAVQMGEAPSAGPVVPSTGPAPRKGQQAKRDIPGRPKSTWIVSVNDYNLLRFEQPVRKAVLPPGAPLAGEPYYLDGNRILMLRFAPDGGKPVQVVVEMADGTTRVLRLVPTKGIAGQIVNIASASASKRASVASVAPISSADPNARYVPALAALVQGARPPGYRSTRVGLVLEYDRLAAIPISAWRARSGTARIVVYRIVPKGDIRLVLDPAQFFRPGVAAAMLTGSVADTHRHPLLYLVTEKRG